MMNEQSILRAAMALLGLATLLPWNAYIKAVPYLRYRLQGTAYATTFPNYITTTFTVSNTLCMALALLLDYQNKLPMMPETRIAMGLTLNMIFVGMSATIPLIDYLKGEACMTGPAYFKTLLGLLAGAGLGTAVLQKGIYEVAAGRLPASCTPYLLLGQALAGLVVSLGALLVVLFGSVQETLGNESRTLAVSCVYFWSAVLVLAAALGSFLWVCGRKYGGLSCSRDLREVKEYPKISLHLFKSIYMFCIGVWLTFFVTLSLYPFTVTFFDSKHRLFIPIAFVLFDLGDLIGKTMPSWGKSILNNFPNKFTVIMPWSRLLFIPLMLTGKYANSDAHLYSSEYLYLMFLSFFAMTNGLANGLLLMKAPMKAAQSDGEESVMSRKEGAGAIMGMFLNLGLSSGSCMSFIWRLIIS